VAPQSNIEGKDFHKTIANKLEKEIDKNEEILATLTRRISSSSLVRIDLSEFETSNPFFVYKDQELVLWSDNRIVPSYSEIEELDTLAYFEKSGWKTVIRKEWIKGLEDTESILIVSLIPLYNDPGISNKYLRETWNEKIFYSQQISIRQINEEEGLKNINYKDQPLFSIQIGENYQPALIGIKYAGLGLIVLGLLWAFIISFNPIKNLIEEGKVLKPFSWFVIYWGFAFFLFKLTDSLNYWESVTLFDSRIYASSWLLNNLLDLLLFSFLLLTLSIYLAFAIRSWRYVKSIVKLSSSTRLLLSSISVLLLLYTITFHFLILRDIYDNSQISLDVNNSLTFNLEKLICLLIFVINAFSVFNFIHTFFKSWLLATRIDIKFLAISFIAGIGLFFLIENNFPLIFLLLVFIIYMALLALSKTYLHFARFNYLSLLYVSGSLILSAIVGAYSINALEQKRDLVEIMRIGNEQLLDADVFGEFLIDQAVQEIQDDPFIGNWMSSPFVSKSIINRKIRQKYLDSYLDRYNIQIFLYNQNGRPLSTNVNAPSYMVAKDRVAVKDNETGFSNVYMAKDFRSDLSKQYFAFIQVKRRDSEVGFILIDFEQKRVAPRNVYPELLLDTRIIQPSGGLKMSYAVYSGLDLLNSVGDFNYQNDFVVDQLQYERIYRNGQHINGNFHVAIDSGPRTLVVSIASHSFGHTLSNFSFLFLLLILLIGIVFTIYILTRDEDSPVRGFASKIQLYLNLAFIIPLILVSITTLSLLSNQSRIEIEEGYLQKGNEIAENIRRDLDNFQLEPNEGRDRLAEQLRTTATILNMDADLYNLSGGHIISTQPKIYEQNLISKYIDPRAWQEIVRDYANYSIKETSVGQLKYNITYIPVRTLNTGKLIGILGLPFFDFKSILESQQIGVLTNILNVFSLLFLILLITSYFVSQRLVIPLKMIAEKLTRTSLTGYNPPIEWHTQDEIGLLVSEYNRMIKNLETSKEILTRTQKELAWREIAKQVAHEIKNPLTPMKLTLQQLQRRITGKQTFEKNEIQKPINSLLYQVDVLRDIATSFSAFAKMPIPEMKRFDLVELLATTFSLHKNVRNVTVNFSHDKDQIFVMGDVKLMGRIAANIIINAIQSSNDSHINIKGKVSVIGKKALISINDDGPGINAEIRDKVFLPSFSTKTEGSGIGLAIAKHGIEQSGGQIWFETEMEKGTTFFIELPLAEE
jgi:signal transduction histidine kinase